MAYTTVVTKAVGDIGLAADWNTYVRDNLSAMVDWTSYTPTLTQGAAVAKTVNQAKYRKFGTTCKVYASLTSTAGGTTGTGILVGLPSGATCATPLIVQGCGAVGFALTYIVVHLAVLQRHDVGHHHVQHRIRDALAEIAGE